MRQATRTKLLTGSLEVFSERGFSAASMAEIARRAGVSKGLAYHYYDTKEDLLEAALGAHLDVLLGLVERLEEIDAPRDRLAALIDGLIDYVQEQPAAFRLYLGLMVQTPAESLAGVLAKLRQPLDAYLAQVYRLFADLGVTDPETHADFFRAALLGMCLRIAMGDDRLPIQALRAQLLQTFAPGAAPPEASR